MKAFLTTLLAITCVTVLLWGNLHWNKNNIVSGDQQIKQESSIDRIKKKTEGTKQAGVTSFTKNWPTQSKAAFEKALEEKKQFKILIVGSEAIGSEENGWAYRTRNKLMETYGEQNLIVEINKYNESTDEFVNSNNQTELAEAGANLILFEPFILSDNGIIKIDDSLDYIGQIMDSVKEVKPDTVFILQPPNPIYSPKYYATQVRTLKEYAEENDIPYLDHWSGWPDPTSEEVKKYLDPETNLPNEDGHKVWSKFITDYFISK